MKGLIAYLLSKHYTDNQSPVGSVQLILSTVVPSGYLQFDGTTYSKSEYPKLYAVLPEVLKDIENETFTLPDLSDRVPQVASLDNIGKLIEAGLPNITGAMTPLAGMQGSSGTGAEGALKSTYFYDWFGNTNGSSNRARFSFRFKASDGETDLDGKYKTDESTKVFGKSNTVQMAAFTFALVIRAK